MLVEYVYIKRQSWREPVLGDVEVVTIHVSSSLQQFTAPDINMNGGNDSVNLLTQRQSKLAMFKLKTQSKFV